MKKPEKKTNKEHTNLTKTFGGGKILTQKAIGYNQAIDDYEKFHEQEKVRIMDEVHSLWKKSLPSEEELEKTILAFIKGNLLGICGAKGVWINQDDIDTCAMMSTALAQTISVRIRE